MSRKRVFITVKTYPTISKKYDELVCTAGILENGDWVRIYPVPFRRLDYEGQYKKYQWIEVDLVRNTEDGRPESFRPRDVDDIRTMEAVDTGNNWEERKRILFKTQKTYTNLKELIEKAHNNELSLAIFKPTEILGVVVEGVDSEWSEEKMRVLKQRAKQIKFFENPFDIVEEFKRVKKLPYKFSYRFKDDAGQESELMIEDWEIGALYWNCLQSSNGNKEVAVEKVKQKYLGELANKDIHLFLGTTKQYHGWAKNPFVIIGVFYPPKVAHEQKPLGLEG